VQRLPLPSSSKNSKETLEPAKLADLTVLSLDIFQVPPQDLAEGQYLTNALTTPSRFMVRLGILPIPDHPDDNGVRRARSNFAFFVEEKIKFLLKCSVQFSSFGQLHIITRAPWNRFDQQNST
jgi:hypothetical protein